MTGKNEWSDPKWEGPNAAGTNKSAATTSNGKNVAGAPVYKGPNVAGAR